MRIGPATDGDLREIEAWRYDPPYDFYDGDAEPVLNPERFHATRDEAGVACFYYLEPQGDVLVYGLGVRPDLTGRGLGLGFFRAGLEYARELHAPARVGLAVAAFNARAIEVYKRAGFRESGRHVRSFPRWGNVEFVNMEEQP